MHILIFGDSVAYGAWDPAGGWVQRLRAWLEGKMKEPFVYNLGISGDTSTGLLQRFEPEAKKRLDEFGNALIIFAIGVNDAAYLNKPGETVTPIGRFQDNIQKLIDQALLISKTIVFLGLNFADDTKADPVPWDLNLSYRMRHITEFNYALETVCRENKIPFIPVIDLLDKYDLADGVHPNTSGHKKLFEAVGEFFIKNKMF